MDGNQRIPRGHAISGGRPKLFLFGSLSFYSLFISLHRYLRLNHMLSPKVTRIIILSQIPAWNVAEPFQKQHQEQRRPRKLPLLLDLLTPLCFLLWIPSPGVSVSCTGSYEYFRASIVPQYVLCRRYHAHTSHPRTRSGILLSAPYGTA